MLPVRTGTLVMLLVALLFGGLAVFIAKAWLAGQQAQVSQQVAPEQVKVDTQKIVVAKTELHFGQPITPEVVSEIDWPKSAVPEGAFLNIADIGKDGPRVALTPIVPNEPILAWKISGPGARASLSALVKDGMRAVTIRVNDTSGVAGFVLPGDRVDVLYTRGQGDEPSIDVLFQNVRVLAVNQSVDEKSGNPIDGRTATLELTPVDAQKLSLAESTGSLTFTLRAAGSLDTAPANRIVEGELVSNAALSQPPAPVKDEAQADLVRRIAELESKLKQDEANRTQQVAAPATPDVPATSEEALPTTAQITIFRGLQGTSYTVPLDANQ
ncbi:Flp pilus assembly protein CpaB [Aestuariivirga sp.]|uniref:Flp pilus assembly protein CpaB n=1 Tax=Aestuariivirga sp. TaxID=2650926 RepID=UPI00301826DA